MIEPLSERSGAAEPLPDGPVPAGERAAAMSLDRIVEDAANSPRLRLSLSRARAFAEIIREQGDAAFPPVVLAGPRADGAFEIVDGRHRVAAAHLAGASGFAAVVTAWGPERERFAAALRLSARSGLPLTNQEKRRAVRRLLREFPERSTRELAEMAATSHALVARCKKEAAPGQTGAPETGARRQPERHAGKLLAAADALSQAVREPEEDAEPALALAAAALRRGPAAEAGPALAALARWIAAAQALLPSAAPAPDGEVAVNG